MARSVRDNRPIRGGASAFHKSLWLQDLRRKSCFQSRDSLSSSIYGKGTFRARNFAQRFRFKVSITKHCKQRPKEYASSERRAQNGSSEGCKEHRRFGSCTRIECRDAFAPPECSQGGAEANEVFVRCCTEGCGAYRCDEGGCEVRSVCSTRITCVTDEAIRRSKACGRDQTLVAACSDSCEGCAEVFQQIVCTTSFSSK